MRSVAATLWRRLGLRQATPARALEAAAQCVHDACAPRWTAAILYGGAAPSVVGALGDALPAGLVELGVKLAPHRAAEVAVPGAGHVVAVGLWPHGAPAGALAACVDAVTPSTLAALEEIRGEAEVAFELAEEAEQLRRDVPTADELAAMRQRTLQRLWHELLTPVALLRAAHEQLRLVETDEAKKRPLRRIGTAVERLGHLFDLLNDILWAREAAPPRVAAAQLAESLLWLSESELQVELLHAGLSDERDALRAAATRLADHARALIPRADEQPSPVDLRAAVRGAAEAVQRSAPDRRVDVEVDASGTELLPAQLVNDALTALLRNALANTPDGSRVVVRAHRTGAGLELAVRDHGVGMPRLQLDAVLGGLGEARDPAWYGTGKPSAFGAGGAGLDLQRLQTLGRWHGWALDAESQLCPHVDGEGRGCPGAVAACGKIPSPGACAALPKGTEVRVRMR